MFVGLPAQTQGPIPNLQWCRSSLCWSRLPLVGLDGLVEGLSAGRASSCNSHPQKHNKTYLYPGSRYNIKTYIIYNMHNTQYTIHTYIYKMYVWTILDLRTHVIHMMYNINPLGCLGSGRKSWSPGMRKDDALSRATGRGGSPEGIAEESAKGKVRWWKRWKLP